MPDSCLFLFILALTYNFIPFMISNDTQKEERNETAMKDRTTEIFANAPIPKAVFSNIIPSIISMLMVLVYNLADTYFIAQTKDPFMVAAVSYATPAFLLFMAIGMLFGIGGTSLISRMLGEGKREKAKHISAFCFWTGICVGVIGMIAIWIFIRPICHVVGSTKETFDYVKQYLLIVSVGVPFLIVGNSFSNIIRAEGNANKAMLGMILGNVTNIILDPVMILGFGWNVAGAAIATVIGNIVAAGFYIFHLISKKSILSIHIKYYQAGDKIAKGVLAIGIPASLNNILMSTSNIIINNLMATYGDMAVAGLGVAMKVNMIAVMLLIGVGTGIQPLLGYCFGAGNRKRFKGVLKFSIALSIILSAIMTIICYVGAGPMVNAFLEEPSAYQYGMQFARTLILSGPLLGILFVMINTIQAMGAALPSLILSISRQGLLYIPIVLSFHFYYTLPERLLQSPELVERAPKMLVMAQPITDYATVALAFVLYVISFKRLFKDKA